MSKPTDYLVTNGWELQLPNIPGVPATSGLLFKTLDGLQKMTNNVELVDSGTNVKYKFVSQIDRKSVV